MSPPTSPRTSHAELSVRAGDNQAQQLHQVVTVETRGKRQGPLVILIAKVCPRAMGFGFPGSCMDQLLNAGQLLSVQIDCTSADTTHGTTVNSSKARQLRVCRGQRKRMCSASGGISGATGPWDV